jgi:N-acetylmuramoyl-L-alanine amidase CwlA
MIQQPAIIQALLTPSPWNRPGILLEDVRAIFLHWTATPNASAMDMRNFFENLSVTHFEVASAHYGISQDGTIVQMVPDNEVSYASGWYVYSPGVNQKLDGANLHRHIISIEVCPADAAGNYTEATMDAQIRLCAWLLQKFNLRPSDLWRHYDACGYDGIHPPKECPKYFVDHPREWEVFKQKVGALL